MSKSEKSQHFTLSLPPVLLGRSKKMKDKKGVAINEYIRTALDEKLTKDGF